MADDPLTVPDWLGREQPISRKGLELTTAGGGSAVTAPATASAGQRAQAVQDFMQSIPPSPSGPSAAQQILGGFKTGVSVLQRAQDLLSRGATKPVIDPTIGAAAERAADPASGGSLVTNPLTSQEPFQIPPDVLSGRGGGALATPQPTTPGGEGAGATEGATEGAVQGAESAGTSALQTTGTVLPYLAAAISVAQDAMSNRQNSIKALDSVIDVAGAVLAPYTYGLSTLAAGLSKEDLDRMNADFQQGNWLRAIALDTFANPVTLVADVVQLFGGPDFTKNFLRGNVGTPYTRTRSHAIEQTNQALSELGGAFQKVQDLPSALSALQQRFGGGHVGTGLQLPEHVASWLGLTPSSNGTYGWTQLDAPQFQRLMTYFAQNPDQIQGAVTSSGDIPFLPQEQAEQVSMSARRATQQLLGAVANAMVLPDAQPGTRTAPPLTPRGPANALGFAQDLFGG